MLLENFKELIVSYWFRGEATELVYGFVWNFKAKNNGIEVDMDYYAILVKANWDVLFMDQSFYV